MLAAILSGYHPYLTWGLILLVLILFLLSFLWRRDK